MRAIVTVVMWRAAMVACLGVAVAASGCGAAHQSPPRPPRANEHSPIASPALQPVLAQSRRAGLRFLRRPIVIDKGRGYSVYFTTTQPVPGRSFAMVDGRGSNANLGTLSTVPSHPCYGQYDNVGDPHANAEPHKRPGQTVEVQVVVNRLRRRPTTTATVEANSQQLREDNAPLLRRLGCDLKQTRLLPSG